MVLIDWDNLISVIKFESHTEDPKLDENCCSLCWYSVDFEY